MSRKKGKYSVECKALVTALEHLLSTIMRAATDQFEGDEIPVDLCVKRCDEFLLSTIRNMITAYFSAMTEMILHLKKDGAKK